MKALLAEVLESDLLLFSYPLYCYGMPAPMKAFADRTIPLSSMGDEEAGRQVCSRRAGELFSPQIHDDLRLRFPEQQAEFRACGHAVQADVPE